METKYPTLKRPKRKLCFPTTKPSSLKPWPSKDLTLGAVDKMFDDLDDELCPLSSDQLTSDSEEMEAAPSPPPPPQQHESQRKATVSNIRSVSRSGNDRYKLDKSVIIVLTPVETSSPLKEKLVEKVDNNGGIKAVVSPILDSEDEQKNTETLNVQKPQPNERNADDEKTRQVKEKTHVRKTETPRKKINKRPMSPVKLEPQFSAAEKSVVTETTATTTTRVGKDVAVFLQKLRDAGQMKPARPRKSLTPVKAPPPPPELSDDDFLILEDDSPLWVSIPKKNTASKRQKQNKTSNTDKDRPGDKEVNEDPTEEREESEKEADEQGGRSVHQNMKKKEEEEVEEPKKKKKQENKKFPSKEKDKVEVETETEAAAGGKTQEEKTEKKVEKKKTKSSNKENDGIKTSKVTSLKETKEKKQSSEDETEKRANVESVPEEKVEQDESPDESDQGPVIGKRRRRPTGQWWMSCPSSVEEVDVTEKQPTVKKKKHTKEIKKRWKQTEETATRNQSEQKQNKNKKTNRSKNKPEGSDAADDVMETQQQEDQDLNQDQDSSPLVLKDLSHSSGDQVFHRVYHHTSGTSATATPRKPVDQTEKRRRKPPGSWWMVDAASHWTGDASSQQQLTPRKEKKKQSKPGGGSPPRLGTPKHGNTAVASKTASSVRAMPPPKTVKRSLATFKNILTSGAETATATATATATNDKRRDDEHDDVRNCETPTNRKRRFESTVKGLISGPSSMVILDQDKSNDTIVPSPTTPPTLSSSDLCPPPLKPLILQPKDEANLSEWLTSLWSPTADGTCEIRPDQFDWFLYQGRALGFLIDINGGSFCSGKMLLGSYMKKPLWVDHSATTVFNLLTSSLSVTIDGKVSRYNPGQSFMVQCGQAYSLQNVAAQPAVLYFTRILAENSD